MSPGSEGSNTGTTGKTTRKTTEEPTGREGVWQLWVDTGGTFTDCLALDPRGRLHRAKVLSSSALRLRVAEVSDEGGRMTLEEPLPAGFAVGAAARSLDGSAVAEVVANEGRQLELSAPLDGAGRGQTLELRFAEEAPVLVSRWVMGVAAGRSLPPLVLRLATTRGTNALLERRGARTAFLVTRGFGDLLVIGDQRRDELFALDLRRPPPLYDRVVEVPERLAADGSIVEPLALEALAPALDALLADGVESVALALLHSYRQPAHERALAEELHRRGVEFVSPSAELAPLAKILPRAQTAVVDAYLAPIIARYLDSVARSLGPSGRFQVMTSAGGLVGREHYRAKDSLLSGPAGGVVGAARCGRELGFERLIAFDMGGTSTDVSRIGGDFEYVFEHRVGDATVAAPALAVETVAAGGGSICWLDGAQAKVGPESAGADPGPACYGAGGPLTLTDVNLLLGRLAEDRFRIPVHPAASRRAFERLLAELEPRGGSARSFEPLLRGFRAIADERMADAVRRISVRRGYDPRDHALLAFGGAGGQHACAVASLLGIETILAPRDAGLLSALGLGTAVVERFAQQQMMLPLDELGESLPETLDRLADEARSAVLAEGIAADEVRVRRRLVFLRLLSQESTLELELGDDVEACSLGEHLTTELARRYLEVYGYPPPDRPIEVESIRVVASSAPPELDRVPLPEHDGSPTASRRQKALIGTDWQEVDVFESDRLEPGDGFEGPALVLDDHATLVVEPGWRAVLASNGTMILRR